ncbi:hypothetical protein [Gemmatimonas phototrophica]|uniref:VCBS repeat-containing protein n=1 Tax=Gemmatimonas phototrophica TaxID=1379270 RepID=A0A143BM84_9BACT|nr:hypothetical protein [Gemmatimonas phototrophica]AMW06128.1 hypothetical protein GEMMAAP_17735 [Gemmatimonas phototrophica]
MGLVFVVCPIGMATAQPAPTARGQLVWSEKAWHKESLRRQLVRDSSISPTALVADFDGDGRRDVAWTVRHQRTGERGILIVHASGRAAQQCGAGVAFGNGGTNYEWMDHWEVIPHDGGKGAALLIAKAESASARIEFRGGRYRWQQRGD